MDRVSLDTMPIIIFSLINQGIRAKCVLSRNTWLVIGVADCRRWRELYLTGQTVQVHIKQNIQRDVCYGFVPIDYGPDWTKHPFLGTLLDTPIHAYV